MAYSFNQLAEIDINTTQLSIAAKEVVLLTQWAHPDATKKDILQALYDSVISGKSAVDHSDLYIYIFDEITSNGAPKAGVEASAWQWVRGAIGTNQNDGAYFSNFIRDYTKEQFSLRGGDGTGSTLPNERIQKASDDIALAVARDILNINRDNEFISNGNLSHDVPNLLRIGEHDAGAIAAGIFNDNYSPWAGTILFPFLGDGGMPGQPDNSSFTHQWMLNSGVDGFKKVPGTYDLLSTVAAAWTVTSLVGAVWSSVDLEKVIKGNTIGETATEALLSDLRDDANQFFQQAYGLANESRFQVGGDLPLYTGLGGAAYFLSRSNYVVGTLKDDSTGILGTSDEDIIHAGLGHDVIKGSLDYDLIDGAEGIDTVDYSALNWDLSIVRQSVTGTIYSDRLQVEKSGGEEPAGIDYVYGVENIKLGGGNDNLDIEGSSSARIIYASAGNDTIKAGSSNDILLGGMGNDTIWGGAGNDIIHGGYIREDKRFYEWQPSFNGRDYS